MMGPESAVATSEERPAGQEAFAALYADLHRIATRELRRNPQASLSPTTLLHETFLNLSRREPGAFSDQPHLLAYTARVMRGLVIDYLRSRNALKRGGDFEITSLPTELPYAAAEDTNVEQLREAMNVLAGIDSRLAECVDLKFFCGFSFNDIADMWQVSERTVQRDWEKARVLLHRLMNNSEAATPVIP